MLSAELPSPDFKSAAEGRMTGDGPVARDFVNGHQAGFEALPCSSNSQNCEIAVLFRRPMTIQRNTNRGSMPRFRV